MSVKLFEIIMELVTVQLKYEVDDQLKFSPWIWIITAKNVLFEKMGKQSFKNERHIPNNLSLALKKIQVNPKFLTFALKLIIMRDKDKILRNNQTM